MAALYRTEYQTPAGVTVPVIIELHPVAGCGSPHWLVQGVHAPKRVKLPSEFTDGLLQRVAELGGLVPVDPCRSSDKKPISEVFGIYRFMPLALDALPVLRSRRSLRSRSMRELVLSIVRLIFWATVVAIRLTLRFVIGLAAWLLGAYVGYRLVRARLRE